MAEKPEVTFLWLTRDHTRTLKHCDNVDLWLRKPKNYDTDYALWCLHDCSATASFGYEAWLQMNPELRLKKGDIIKIRRTSIIKKGVVIGFKWERCED
jgi:hypothetical protein